MDFREPLDQLIHSPLKFTGGKNFPPAERIRIYDSTLRDGEQMPGVAFSPGQKFELAVALSDIGVDVIDLGFPMAALSDRRALQLIAQGKHSGVLRKDLE